MIDPRKKEGLFILDSRRKEASKLGSRHAVGRPGEGGSARASVPTRPEERRWEVMA